MCTYRPTRDSRPTWLGCRLEQEPSCLFCLVPVPTRLDVPPKRARIPFRPSLPPSSPWDDWQRVGPGPFFSGLPPLDRSSRVFCARRSPPSSFCFFSLPLPSSPNMSRRSWLSVCECTHFSLSLSLSSERARFAGRLARAGEEQSFAGGRGEAAAAAAAAARRRSSCFFWQWVSSQCVNSLPLYTSHSVSQWSNERRIKERGSRKKERKQRVVHSFITIVITLFKPKIV